MSEKNERETRWTFEIIFWMGLVVAALLYISYGILPEGDRLRRHEEQLKTAQQEAEKMEAEIARTRATVKALNGEKPVPEVTERELRKLGYKRPGETRILLSDE